MGCTGHSDKNFCFILLKKVNYMPIPNQKKLIRGNREVGHFGFLT